MKKLKNFWLFYVLVLMVCTTSAVGVAGENNITVTNKSMVNVSTEYQLAGYSTGSTSGNAGGVGGMHALCQADFGEHARMCTTKEWWTSPNAGPPPLNARTWISPSPVGTFAIPYANYMNGDPILSGWTDWTGYKRSQFLTVISSPPTCFQWTRDAASREGSVITEQGVIEFDNCPVTNPVTCCTPANR
jgi:hypothetical protein